MPEVDGGWGEPARPNQLHDIPNRSEWVDEHTWRDPDCFECGGEGAPCCEPPDGPPPRQATGRTYLDLVRELGEVTCQRCDPECSPALHRQEAATFIGALMSRPDLIASLIQKMA